MKISILGVGNIGSSIAKGLVSSKDFKPKNIFLTRKRRNLLEDYEKLGFSIAADNKDAVKNSEIVIVAVTPQQLDGVLNEIKDVLNPAKHKILSVVSGASIKQIKEQLGVDLPVVRVMPNTAIAIRESMTCISGDNEEAVSLSVKIFDKVGKCAIIPEEHMVPATALCACGIAFFMRAIRAASQGGIEIGFHADEALFMAAQTAKGAAAMLLDAGNHPEREVDRVTTPQGCTITGLNNMEHSGFSSALIKGIVSSAEKAKTLYS